MIFIYRFLINIIFVLSPIIIIFRLIKRKEHPIRFKEKFLNNRPVNEWWMNLWISIWQFLFGFY